MLIFSNTQSFTYIKDSFHVPGLSNGTFMVLPGKLKWTFSKLSTATVGVRSRVRTRIQQHCCRALPQHSSSGDRALLLRHPSAPLHFTVSENKKQTTKRLSAQQTACRRAENLILCVISPEPRTSQLLALSHQPQCSCWATLGGAARCRERKQVLELEQCSGDVYKTMPSTRSTSILDYSKNAECDLK